jgi:ABC-type Mn2+/Zn2+ transport system permease subunit
VARAWRVVATAPAAARALTKHPAPAMALAVVLALATVWIAIAASYRTNWPIGFFVGVGSAAYYILARIGASAPGCRAGSGGGPGVGCNRPHG